MPWILHIYTCALVYAVPLPGVTSFLFLLYWTNHLYPIICTPLVKLCRLLFLWTVGLTVSWTYYTVSADNLAHFCLTPAMSSLQVRDILTPIYIPVPSTRTPSEKICWMLLVTITFSHTCSLPPLPVAMEIILLSRTAVEGICRRSIAHFVGTMSVHRITNYVNSRKQCFLLFFWSVIIESYNRKCSSMQYFIWEKHKVIIYNFLSTHCNSIPFSLTKTANSKYQWEWCYPRNKAESTLIHYLKRESFANVKN